ncbi:aminotransferase IV [Lewinellaceae bacterium SD302]|nr:aminotransferase IV [Lewinellaceae bacterium SD302]
MSQSLLEPYLGYMLPITYLNGAYLPSESAQLHFSDLSILRGFAVFDYFRYLNRRPRFLADHLARFRNSAREMGMPFPLSDQELTEVVHQLIERNEAADGGIRFVLTGGYALDGYTPTTPNLLAMAYPHKAPPEKLYRHGAKILLYVYRRQTPRVKTTDYIQGIRLIPELEKTGCDFPLYVTEKGIVLESDRSNVFIVRDGVLITPAEGVLLGITRKHLIALAGELSIPVEERVVTLEELLLADEAIIASSTKGAMPITATNQGVIAAGKVGPITQRLMDHWGIYCEGK